MYHESMQFFGSIVKRNLIQHNHCTKLLVIHSGIPRSYQVPSVVVILAVKSKMWFVCWSVVIRIWEVTDLHNVTDMCNFFGDLG